MTNTGVIRLTIIANPATTAPPASHHQRGRARITALITHNTGGTATRVRTKPIA